MSSSAAQLGYVDFGSEQVAHSFDWSAASQRAVTTRYWWESLPFSRPLPP
ncbi:hypothetical protein F4556_000413 [Kitasatospora gansuensis]|uniref:Uncharacterized protein n=2 Tax=Kitasatospora TaxID=2063 RepID=A0A7W7WFE5_9ACTN|nr:hypothetical protein [Kitasatospora gansuensis]